MRAGAEHGYARRLEQHDDLGARVARGHDQIGPQREQRFGIFLGSPAPPTRGRGERWARWRGRRRTASHRRCARGSRARAAARRRTARSTRCAAGPRAASRARPADRRLPWGTRRRTRWTRRASPRPPGGPAPPPSTPRRRGRSPPRAFPRGCACARQYHSSSAGGSPVLESTVTGLIAVRPVGVAGVMLQRCTTPRSASAIMQTLPQPGPQSTSP